MKNQSPTNTSPTKTSSKTPKTSSSKTRTLTSKSSSTTKTNKTPNSKTPYSLVAQEHVDVTSDLNLDLQDRVEKLLKDAEQKHVQALQTNTESASLTLASITNDVEVNSNVELTAKVLNRALDASTEATVDHIYLMSGKATTKGGVEQPLKRKQGFIGGNGFNQGLFSDWDVEVNNLNHQAANYYAEAGEEVNLAGRSEVDEGCKKQGDAHEQPELSLDDLIASKTSKANGNTNTSINTKTNSKTDTNLNNKTDSNLNSKTETKLNTSNSKVKTSTVINSLFAEELFPRSSSLDSSSLDPSLSSAIASSVSSSSRAPLISSSSIGSSTTASGSAYYDSQQVYQMRKRVLSPTNSSANSLAKNLTDNLINSSNSTNSTPQDSSTPDIESFSTVAGGTNGTNSRLTGEIPSADI